MLSYYYALITSFSEIVIEIKSIFLILRMNLQKNSPFIVDVFFINISMSVFLFLIAINKEYHLVTISLTIIYN